MGKEEMMNPQLQYNGVLNWRKAGFTGKGIKVWNSEGISGDHGANSAQIIVDVAPDVDLISGSMGKSTKGDELISCTVRDDQDNGATLTFEDFIIKYQPQLISSSNKGPQNKEFSKFIAEMRDKYKLCIFNSAGNEGSGGVTGKFPIDVAISIGAANLTNNGTIKRAEYSSIGPEIDFMQFVLWWGGTSAACPSQAGMCAMIMQRYGHMSQYELYKYLQMIAMDMQASGHDDYTGWGQPILPDIGKKYITMTTSSNDYYIDGQKRTMDTRPVNKEGNVFVPVRAISESFGKGIEAIFNPDKTIKVLISDPATRIELNTGSDIMFVNGRKIILNFPPYIDGNNRTLVPIRAISEAFGCKVDWVQKEAKVMILEA